MASSKARTGGLTDVLEPIEKASRDELRALQLERLFVKVDGCLRVVSKAIDSSCYCEDIDEERVVRMMAAADFDCLRRVAPCFANLPDAPVVDQHDVGFDAGETRLILVGVEYPLRLFQEGDRILRPSRSVGGHRVAHEGEEAIKSMDELAIGQGEEQREHDAEMDGKEEPHRRGVA